MIKGQTFTNFVAKFTYSDTTEIASTIDCIEAVKEVEEEYEALIVGLFLAKELQVHNLRVYNDSQLVVNQVNDIYRARVETMVAYLGKAKELMKAIPTASIEVIQQSKNANINTLAKLASTIDVKLLDVVPVEFLVEPSIKLQLEVMEQVHEPSWMDPKIEYLKNGKLLEGKTEA